MNIPAGKNIFIENARIVSDSSIDQFLAEVDEGDFQNLFFLVADGLEQRNLDEQGKDSLKPFFANLKERSKGVWCWQKIKGNEPVKEAEFFIQRIVSLEPDGIVIEPSAEFETSNKKLEAGQYLNRLRRSFSELPFALLIHKFPNMHPAFPWEHFLGTVDLTFPKVFWDHAHNPRAHLIRSLSEFQNQQPFRPVIPAVPAYTLPKWNPEADFGLVVDSMEELKLPGLNFYTWDSAIIKDDLWQAVKKVKLAANSSIDPVIKDYFDALNSGDIELVKSCYLGDAVRIANKKSVTGYTSIADQVDDFLHQLPDARFTVASITAAQNSRTVRWSARSNAGAVEDGSDSIGLIDGRIAYHASTYTIRKA